MSKARQNVDKLNGWISVKEYGATGDGVTDDTAAIQTALNSGAKRIFLPDGVYGIKASGAALILSASDCHFYGSGVLKPIANANGWAPEQMLVVSGSRNCVSVTLWNEDNLSKQASTPSNEFPMDGIRITGSNNVIENCGVFNFVTGIVVRGGTGNQVRFNNVSVKQVSNFTWPNDAILWFLTNYGLCVGNTVGWALSASDRTIQLENVTGASTTDLRTAITLDANTSSIVVADNIIGEGFIAGVHSEGTGTRRHVITNNVIFKQRRNAINAAGKNLQISANVCWGSFNTDTTANLTGIIGSIDGNAIVANNLIYCDTNQLDGVRILANTDNVQIIGNQFVGTFQSIVRGIVNNSIVEANILNGSAIYFVNLEKPTAVSGAVANKVAYNVANGITTKFALIGSGATVDIIGNKICLIEGFLLQSVIQFGGGFSGLPSECAIRIENNEAVYIGTTALSGTSNFVQSAASGAAPGKVSFQGNAFDPSKWTALADGTFLSATNTVALNNSTNTITGVATKSGSFTLGAVATTSVSNTSVAANSIILFVPTNAGAATLMSGSKSLFVSAVTAGVGFSVQTADSAAAAGTETFSYVIAS